MRVLTINDLLVGEVGDVRDCCFEVRAADGLRYHLSPDCIFNVVDARVSLVCMIDHILVYSCKVHGVKTGQALHRAG